MWKVSLVWRVQNQKLTHREKENSFSIFYILHWSASLLGSWLPAVQSCLASFSLVQVEDLVTCIAIIWEKYLTFQIIIIDRSKFKNPDTLYHDLSALSRIGRRRRFSRWLLASAGQSLFLTRGKPRPVWSPLINGRLHCTGMYLTRSRVPSRSNLDLKEPPITNLGKSSNTLIYCNSFHDGTVIKSFPSYQRPYCKHPQYKNQT